MSLVYFLVMIFISVVVEVMVAALIIRIYGLGNKFFITVTVLNLVTANLYGLLNFYYGSAWLAIGGVFVLLFVESAVIYYFHRRRIGPGKAALISVILNAAGGASVLVVGLIFTFFENFFSAGT